MRIFFIGDIVGEAGVSVMKKNLGPLLRQYPSDIVIANGENAAEHNGITKDIAEELHYAGVDVITLGNHAFRRQSVFPFLDDCPYIVRPVNYSADAPGHGKAEVKTPAGNILVVSIAGRVSMEPADDPFRAADAILQKTDADFVVFDLHAEATSEKKAFGYYVDQHQKPAAVFGTHTHVQTADERFLPNGTAYLTDVGMTGADDSVLGAKKELAIARFLKGMYLPLEQSSSDPVINAVYADTERKIIERINHQPKGI